MKTRKVTPGQLSIAIRSDLAMVRRAQRRACDATADRFARHLAAEADRLGISDTGAFRDGWRVERLPSGRGSRVVNDAPYAGVVEFGARPHKVNRAGIESIAEWATRKLGVPEERARGVAFAVAQKISREGQKPTYIVRNSLPVARAFYRQELTKALRGGG